MLKFLQAEVMFPIISPPLFLSKLPYASFTVISDHPNLRSSCLPSARLKDHPLCSLTTRISIGQAATALSDGSESDSDSLALFDDNDNVEDDSENDILLPFSKMNQWLKNKPQGFGDGKTYDTSIEDKLLDEMAQSRRAQALNLAQLKSGGSRGKQSTTPIPKETSPLERIRVRVSNLPKKKNIHRDLNTAFKDVRGIISIIPAVSANKKTKDPICKGLAFAGFTSQKNADRFVDQFSGKMVEFGKIQKQIKCHHVKDESPGTSKSKEAETSEVEIVESFTVTSFEEIICDESDALENNVIDVAIKDVSDTQSQGTESAEKIRRQSVNASKKKSDSRKNGNLAKGSAKRLKVREKALWTGVVTKYASNS